MLFLQSKTQFSYTCNSCGGTHFVTLRKDITNNKHSVLVLCVTPLQRMDVTRFIVFDLYTQKHGLNVTKT